MNLYGCSRCGFSAGTARAVAEHIHLTHAQNARIREFEFEVPNDAGLPRRFLHRLLEEYLEVKRYHRGVRD